jgi:(2Fe-2S) ferredoxin
MKHQITVKLEVEALVEVDLREGRYYNNTDRRTARKLVRQLVDEGRIAADPTYNEHYSHEDDPIVPEWAEVELVNVNYGKSHIEQ